MTGEKKVQKKAHIVEEGGNGSEEYFVRKVLFIVL